MPSFPSRTRFQASSIGQGREGLLAHPGDYGLERDRQVRHAHPHADQFGDGEVAAVPLGQQSSLLVLAVDDHVIGPAISASVDPQPRISSAACENAYRHFLGSSRMVRVSEEDRVRWDERYVSRGAPPIDAVGPAAVFAPYQGMFPTAGRALDVACGQGLGAVWLARRGLDAWGVDVSEVAIGQARDLARRDGVADRCRFDVVDLDHGLPTGPPVTIIYCHRFRDRRLDRAMIERLAPGGLLAVTTLSQVGSTPGPFRAAPGELHTAFADLDRIAAGEGQGQAWLLARRTL